jgi:uncharacterized protein (TIGR03000 family)
MKAFMIFGFAAWMSLFFYQSSARAQTGEMPVVMNMTVPADAQIWIDGNATTQTGSNRTFTSPPLPNGRKYVYQVRVVMGDREEDRRVSVRGGDRINLNFMGAEVEETRQETRRSSTAVPATAPALPASSASSSRRSFSSFGSLKKAPTGQ